MPTQPTPDLDARFSVFLNPIRDLTKNWEVDIAKYLEDYLVELSEIQITFDGGVTVMNFAEAAMLIQGSATVYSKKVEFLWQMVLQMLDLLSSKRSLDLGVNENPKQVKSCRETATLEFEKVDIMPNGKHIDMKDDQEEEERREEFKFLPRTPLHLVEKEGEKSALRITLYLKNFETFGNKDDFRLNRSYLTPSGLLCLDLPPEILHQNVRNVNEEESGISDSVAGFYPNIPVPPNENPSNAITPDDGVDHGGGVDVDDDPPMEIDINLDTPAAAEDPIDEPEPENLVEEPEIQNPIEEEGIQKPSEEPKIEDTEPVNEKEVEQDNASDQGLTKSDSVVTLNGKYGLRKRGPKEKLAEVNPAKLLSPLDPHIETPAKRPVRAGRIRKPLPCSCHKEVLKKISRSRSKVLKEASNKRKSSSVESFIIEDLVKIMSNNNNNTKKEDLVDSKILEEYTKEKAKQQEILKKERVQEILNKEGKSISNNEAKKKVEEEEEAKKRAEDEGDLDDDDVPDIDFDNIENQEDFLLPNPHNDIYTPYGHINDDVDQPHKSMNDSLLYEPSSEYEALVQKWVSDYIASAQEHISSSELTKRVNKWRKNITPKLSEEEERKTFDIHEYGSYVLSHFTAENEGKYVLFEEIAQSDDSREVARIFLSCLMLANTYNVDLSQTKEGDLEMDCLQLKLLSKVRHHEEFEEYAAPSQAVRNPSPSSKAKKSKRKKVQTSSDEEEEWVISEHEEIEGVHGHEGFRGRIHMKIRAVC